MLAERRATDRSRAAPTSMCDNGLSQSWFRKLLKLLARRDDDGHKFQSAPSRNAIFFSVSYLDILKLDRADLDEVLPANVFADFWRSDSGRLRAARRWIRLCKPFSFRPASIWIER